MSEDINIGEFTLKAEYTIFDPPKPNWEWCFNGDWHAIMFRVHYTKPPSRFHRWMMKILLGIHWREYKEKGSDE